MLMSDYLNGTSATIDYLTRQVKYEIDRFESIDIDLAEFDDIENYLKNGDTQSNGKALFEEMSRSMCEPPAIEDIVHWRKQLENMFIGSQISIDTMCSSILIIAQTGIKRVFGAPKKWEQHIGNVKSAKGECLFQTIWHGRNLAAHVEGLTQGGKSHDFFKNVELRRNIDVLSNSAIYPNRVVVRDLLGWIEPGAISNTLHKLNGKSVFHQDMLRIGKLA